MKTWTSLCIAIVSRVLEVNCRPKIDWLYVALTLKTGNDKSPLAMPRPTAPLEDGDLLHNMHHILTRQFPRLDPCLQRVNGLLIATHIREVTVEMRRDSEEKALDFQADIEKRVPELLGSNFT